MRLLSFAILFSVTSLACAEDKKSDYPLVEAKECRPRDGLPNFLAKANTPASNVKVAYFGGSITAQPGWRVKTLADFQQRWPQAKFSEINAAIGGTGSDLGVHRLQQDVLQFKPDLMFVEFAVNDGGAAPEQIHRCMEGIVRQTWRALPDCDICFVYTVTEALVPAMLEGKFQRSASAMEAVANHYKIPTIHMGMEVAKLAKAGKLLWKAKPPKSDAEKATLGDKFVFAPDSVHPHVETGHELYLQAIVRSLKPIQEATGKPASHALGSPLVADNFENAKLLPISEAVMPAGAQWLDPAKDEFGKRWANRMTTLHKITKAGDTIRFKFKGTKCSIYYIVGPDGGQVKVTLDGKTTVRPAFDSYCTYHRLSVMGVGDNLPDAVHDVVLELDSQGPDKAKILAQRNEKMDKPERFAQNNFYPGAILLVGELVK